MKGIIITMLLCLMACNSSQKNEPEHLIQKDQMSNILTDLHLVEAKVQNMGLKSSDSSNLMFEKLEQEVLLKYKVSKKDYDSSYAYYARNLKELDAIYAKAIDSLSLRQSKLSDL